MAQTTGITILRKRDVCARTGLSRSNIYSKIQAGEFPESISLGPRAVGWASDAIDKWIAQRIAAGHGVSAISAGARGKSRAA